MKLGWSACATAKLVSKMHPKVQLGGRLKTFIVLIGQAIGTVIALVVTFIAAALLAFIPLTALPGELQTDFVNGSWVLPIWVAVFGVLLAVRLGPLSQKEAEPWWPSTLRAMWRFLSTFVACFWLAGAVLWLNSFGVQASRTHDMLVTGYEESAARGAVSTINHYKLAELGTSWRADLQPTYERDEFLKVGECVRVTVRPGRLGFDWISDARPIECHN